MRLSQGRLTLSASDLANHLGCGYLTRLDLAAARRELEPPRYNDPTLEVLQELGRRHEQRYVEHLAAQGLRVRSITEQDEAAVAATRAALRDGFDVVVQGTLVRDGWLGRPDILRRLPEPGPDGGHRYEVHDTKLARETRAGTMLQLCLYSDLLSDIQGVMPERFFVVTPGAATLGGAFDEREYRLADYLAYYRFVRGSLLGAAASGSGATEPEPVPHCEVCRWWLRCDRSWRDTDHLSLVAGITRLQRRELESRQIVTLAGLAVQPDPLGWRPARGSREGMERSQRQARIQLHGRASGRPVHELLLPVEAGRGLTRLPEPSLGDLFLDLEGDPFIGTGGREYLFGTAAVDAGGDIRYESVWGLTERDERTAFETLVDRIMTAWERHPDMHVYHYAPYEPAAFKRLMGRYGTREDEIDRLLRAERFVDLLAVVRHGLRASVERYSIKDLEPFFGLERAIPLRDVAPFKRMLERALELEEHEAITGDAQAAVEAYNRDDCVSALELRRWLESLRAELVAGGVEVPRPEPKSGDATEQLNERLLKVRELAAQLTAGLPPEPAERTAEQHSRWRLAQMLEFHRREQKAVWWEYYRLEALDDEDLADEQGAIVGLEFVAAAGGTPKCPVHRYRYPAQKCEIRKGVVYTRGSVEVGEIFGIDLVARTVDITKRMAARDLHPASIFVHDSVNNAPIEQALVRLAEDVRDHGMAADGANRAARVLLTAAPPRFHDGAALEPLPGENSTRTAIRLGLVLDGTVLPIQGPPGSGKTYTGARMILELVRVGRTVGVCGTSHKVIDNLLQEIVREAARKNDPVRIARKVSEDPAADTGAILHTTDNGRVRSMLENGEAQIAAGTPWLWSRPEFARAVDVLFVDEAGQMSLANVLAISQAADSLVLLGDPRQLDQPVQGSHPDGVAVSALEHLLQGHATVPPDRGLFLAETWRLPPAICAYTSETFYENRLFPRPDLERQVLDGDTPYAGSGLWYMPVEHDGNTNTAPEEVDAVEGLVRSLLAGTHWTDRHGDRHPLGPEDIMVVAPYNAHVGRIAERLKSLGVRAGTVDRFQGQQAPVVIVSLATSTPEEAPRGMEFLYSLNRLNVATSRAQCACILVASPRLFDPECRTPRHMRLANAFCRYLEVARSHETPLPV